MPIKRISDEDVMKRPQGKKSRKGIAPHKTVKVPTPSGGQREIVNPAQPPTSSPTAPEPSSNHPVIHPPFVEPQNEK